MLAGRGVSYGCDFWALGVLVYEMLHGLPPFSVTASEPMAIHEMLHEPMAIYVNILNSNVAPFDADVTQEARSLIHGLLNTHEATRLGRDLLNHAWFADFKADEAVNFVLKPPWCPHLQHADDMKLPSSTNYAPQREAAMAAAFASPELINTYEHVWSTFRST